MNGRGVCHCGSIWVAGAAIVLLSAALAGAADGVSQQEIDALIRDLGADSYKVRERATAALRRIGAAAIPALEKATQSDDPEVAIRAAAILTDARMGLGPDWPPELVKLVRNYDLLKASDRQKALTRLSGELKVRAVPFLLYRMGIGEAAEAARALQCLKNMGAADVYRAVIASATVPKNEHQAQALALAYARTDQPAEALRALAGFKGGGLKGELTETAVKRFLELLAAAEHRKLVELSAPFAAAAPHEARFLYLRAEGLAALGRGMEAEALQERAVALNPKKEAPHYTAGEMLGKLGLRRLAAGEWRAILKIPPAGGVYDINAHLRLASIHAASKMYARAADNLAEALVLYRQARAGGGGMGMIGGDEQDLVRKIENFRAKAARQPAPPDARIRDARPTNELDVQIGATVKDGKAAELREAMKKVSGTLSMSIQPHGLRLFDVTKASVRYDAANRQIGVYLNGSLCGKPTPMELGPDAATVAVKTLDCVYIFRIDTKAGQATRTARYEKDYTVTFRPGREIADCTDVTVKINGKPYEWKTLLAGARFDFLPESFDIRFEGTRPTGEAVSIRAKLKLKEPASR